MTTSAMTTAGGGEQRCRERERRTRIYEIRTGGGEEHISGSGAGISHTESNGSVLKREGYQTDVLEGGWRRRSSSGGSGSGIVCEKAGEKIRKRENNRQARRGGVLTILHVGGKERRMMRVHVPRDLTQLGRKEGGAERCQV